jgi:Endonuclease/Exonuclease/phosphatase family
MQTIRKSWPAVLACGVLVLASARVGGWRNQPPVGTGAVSTGEGLRLLSWNVSSDAFVRDPATFRALLTRADADILLFDEVSPATTEAQLRAALAGRRREGSNDWHISVGSSGGRQRGVIASVQPLERLPELSEVVPYPAAERERLHKRMVAADADRPAYSMDGGIPVNGALVTTGARRLLVVIVDLQCCGNDPASWEEDRRRVEAAELRRRIGGVLKRTRVDGVIVAGDLNLVSTPLPMVSLSGPYPAPHAGLIAAELLHVDGSETWTWDGRGSQFPSRPMDFILYGPHALQLRTGYILDSADLGRTELDKLGLTVESAGRLSKHLPLVAEFVWR